MHPIAQRCDNSPPKRGFSLFKNTGIAVPEWALTISCLVNWLADKEGATLEQKRHHFTEAVIRMHSVHVQDKVGEYKKNIAKLDDFMASPATDDRSLKYLLDDYKNARNTLSDWAYENAAPVYGPSDLYHSAIKQTGWKLAK